MEPFFYPLILYKVKKGVIYWNKLQLNEIFQYFISNFNENLLNKKLYILYYIWMEYLKMQFIQKGAAVLDFEGFYKHNFM